MHCVWAGGLDPRSDEYRQAGIHEIDVRSDAVVWAGIAEGRSYRLEAALRESAVDEEIRDAVLALGNLLQRKAATFLESAPR